MYLRLMILTILVMFVSVPAHANGKSFGFGPVGKVADCVNPWALDNCFALEPVLKQKSQAKKRGRYALPPAHKSQSAAQYKSRKMTKPSRSLRDPRIRR